MYHMGSPWYLEAPVKALDHVRVLHNGCVRKLMMVYFSSSSIAAASKTWKWGWSLKLRLFPLPPLAKPEVERSLPSWTMRHVALNHERPYRSYSRRPALASARTSAVYWRPSPPPSTSRRTLSQLMIPHLRASVRGGHHRAGNRVQWARGVDCGKSQQPRQRIW